MVTFTSTVSTAAANATKYRAGGSGDNIIADGYIKTVEKIWMDTYTIAFTNTLTAIAIAELPANKKITSIEIDIWTTTTHTSGTISVGYLKDASDVLATTGVAELLAPTVVTAGVNATTRTTISLPGGFVQFTTPTSGSITAGTAAGFQAVTGGTKTTIAIKLNNWVATTGTIKTIVRYT